MKKSVSRKKKPYCFVSYSSKENHVPILFPCLWIVLEPHFDLRLTPSALESGADQHSQIVDLIKECTFAVVVLDGLRPNVTYEYGLLEALDKPIILLKEQHATVDIRSFIDESVDLDVTSPVLKIDNHFSNIKGVYYAEWNRLDPAATVKTIWREYKKKSKITGYVEIKEPMLWDTQN